MEIIFLGTAGSIARKNRDNTSLVIKQKNNFLLIDVPGAIVQKFRRLGIDYYQINNIFVTHIHPDHIYGLPAFIHARMFDSDSVINIFGHKESLKFIRKLLSIFRLRRKNFPNIKFHKLQPDSCLSISHKIEIITFKTKHSLESLGLKIKYKNNSIVYTSDTAYSLNTVKMSAGVDYLIHDCFAPTRFFKAYPQLLKMHSSPETIARVYKKSKFKTVIPIHFSGELDFKISEISQELRSLGVKNFFIPQDLQRLKIT
jgi:ribonuclease Z